MVRVLGRILGVAERRERMRILYVAAGAGVWGIGVAQQSPPATVTAVDWHVLEVTRRFAAGRFSYVAGDGAEVDFGRGFALRSWGAAAGRWSAKHSRRWPQAESLHG
jgi:hypothetical protein